MTSVQRHGQLKIVGTQLLDQHGEVVVLRGMSLFWSQWMGQYYNADAVAWLQKDWNINVIRAAVGVTAGSGYLTNPDVERSKVQTVIDAAIKQGIYVIVDWHAHDPEPEAASQFFSSIAQKYGQVPNIIYETWNEPLPKYDWSTVIKPYHNKVISSIRAFDADNVILVGTQSWSQDVDKAANDPLGFANVGYSLHFYASTHREELRNKALYAINNGLALFVTEWGTSEASGTGRLDAKERQLWFDFMDLHKLSWCNWSVADKAESSAALQPGASGRGGWEDRQITESGLIVRSVLRAKN